jgi:hypothetical protein
LRVKLPPKSPDGVEVFSYEFFPLYTTHPFIKRDEFKPVESKKNEWKFKVIRWQQGDGAKDLVLSKVEDGPGESFLLWVHSSHLASEPVQTEPEKTKRVQIQQTESLLDQDTVDKIAERPDGVEFEGCDFVIIED